MSFCMNLEDYLIPPKEWRDRYNEMPAKCQKVVDNPNQGGPIGIGHKEDKGWFILCSGQGPFVAWQEKKDQN